ncbi:MAG: hypothetical protein JXB48_07800, partial [Candidatus Latescibacteria bacterium]|nr:hypothetical protein [Candidatus Latescibacterota bacterium]
MRLIIFEHEGYELLYPLTYLRATFELRCGHTTLGEKICRETCYTTETAYCVREILAPIIKQRFPGSKVNDPLMFKGENLLLVDGRVLALDKLPVPENDGIILHGDSPVIARISADKAKKLPADTIANFL